MLKFNAQSILSLKDEPLKKESHPLKLTKGKENQKMNLIENAQVDNINDQSFIKDWKESTKKKYRRSVLRREAEKSFPKDDDLIWDPSFISISSLSQVQLSNVKVDKSQIKNELKSEIKDLSEIEVSTSENQSHLNDVALDFIDEVIEICMALNKRPVRVAPIEKLARLQSRSDFKFRNLADIKCQAVDSVCLRVTSNLALSASDLVDKTIATNENHNFRDFNALLLSLQILINASTEVGFENKDHKELINRKLVSSLAQKCLNELKKNNKDIKMQDYSEVKLRIQDAANQLSQISQAFN